VRLASIVRSHRSEQVKSLAPPHQKRSVINSGPLGPFFDWKCQAIVSNRYSATLISALRLLIGPAAIIRRVAAIIVDSVQRQTFWAWAHIAVERSRIIHPLIAHRNTATAVRWICSRFLIRTAMFRRAPCSILLFWNDPRLSISSCKRSRAFTLKTATALSRAVYQHAGSNRDGRPAFTATNPAAITALFFFGKSDYCQAAKSLAGQIFEVIRAFVTVMFSHDASRGVVVRAAVGATNTARLAYFTA
jgi:hypothetical protein